MKRPILLGHRGFSAKYPENSLLAFRMALRAGADGWECDLQKTGDGRFVIIHDAVLERVSGKKGNVADLRLKTIRKSYALGRNQPVPTLLEMLKILPADKVLNLELKEETITASDCPTIYRSLKKFRKPEYLMVTSFDYRILEYFRKRKMPVGYLAGNSHGARGILEFIFRSLFRDPDYCNIPVQALEGKYRFIGYPMVRLLRMIGRKMIFWVVNNRKQLERCLPFAYGIITDDPERMMKELK